MKSIGIFYGSSSGNTETVAKQIQKGLGADAQIFEVSKAKKEDLEKFDNLILGTSTWGFGDLQDDFEGFMSQIEAANLSGKTVALFGCGDQESYSDTFVNGMGQGMASFAKQRLQNSRTDLYRWLFLFCIRCSSRR